MTPTRSRRRKSAHRTETFASRGRRLGLSEELVVEALCRAITVAGPSLGGRFVGPLHAVGDDETSRIAVAELEALAREGEGRGTVSQLER